MEDLISRQAAIDAFNTGVDELIVEGKGNAEAVEKYLNGVIGRIKDLPSAQPEPLTNIQDILEYLDTVLHPIISPEHWDVYSELHDMISVLPSAQPEWIPCSKRLPKEKDAGILKKLGTSKRSDYVLATVEVKNERMTVTACTYDGAWHWNKKYAFPDYKVIAWMPLPEPWKGE